MMHATTKSSDRMGCTLECWMPRVDWMASNLISAADMAHQPSSKESDHCTARHGMMRAPAPPARQLFVEKKTISGAGVLVLARQPPSEA